MGVWMRRVDGWRDTWRLRRLDILEVGGGCLCKEIQWTGKTKSLRMLPSRCPPSMSSEVGGVA